MSSSIGNIDITAVVLIWVMPIPDSVANIFTMIFVTLSELIEYISKDIIKRDTFHLIIPLNCFEELHNDPIYKFPQVRRIDVCYDDIGDLSRIPRDFNLECGKIRFCSVYDLLRRLESVAVDEALVPSDPIDRNTINGIISSISDRIFAKRWSTLIRRCHVLNQIGSTIVYGVPLKNINEIDSRFICSSCKLCFKQLNQLECGHRKCVVCLNIEMW